MRAKEFIDEHRMVFRKNPRTGKISLRWRCESGPRKNRTVPNVKDCSGAPDVAQSQRMKKTRQRTKIRQARRAKRTKNINPFTKLSAILNKLARKR